MFTKYILYKIINVPKTFSFASNLILSCIETFCYYFRTRASLYKCNINISIASNNGISRSIRLKFPSSSMAFQNECLRALEWKVTFSIKINWKIVKRQANTHSPSVYSYSCIHLNFELFLSLYPFLATLTELLWQCLLSCFVTDSMKRLVSYFDILFRIEAIEWK